MGYSRYVMSKKLTPMEEIALEFGLPQEWIDENIKGIRRGVEDMKAGRVSSWEQVE
ncbi:hypothetical protein LCGC14_3024930 [marine sediment metagenome]|uniref:Uncharacterized protein n=1 Tax=marine sediment metagenome TaxID=412755 RepID=A0A0F8WUM3_9ZZZZ